jgi:U3 small nucleolar ribonucleoprotein protein IMP4
MTIVTTSRKPVPELRSLAKDFAFAADCPYILRGKMGLPEIDSLDPVFFIFSSRGKEFSLQLLDHGTPVADIRIPAWSMVERSGERLPGILIDDPSIYERLTPYIPVKLSETGGMGCLFDGTRKRRYLLRLMIHEA